MKLSLTAGILHECLNIEDGKPREQSKHIYSGRFRDSDNYKGLYFKSVGSAILVLTFFFLFCFWNHGWFPCLQFKLNIKFKNVGYNFHIKTICSTESRVSSSLCSQTYLVCIPNRLMWKISCSRQQSINLIVITIVKNTIPQNKLIVVLVTLCNIIYLFFCLFLCTLQTFVQIKQFYFSCWIITREK